MDARNSNEQVTLTVGELEEILNETMAATAEMVTHRHARNEEEARQRIVRELFGSDNDEDGEAPLRVLEQYSQPMHYIEATDSDETDPLANHDPDETSSELDEEYEQFDLPVEDAARLLRRTPPDQNTAPINIPPDRSDYMNEARVRRGRQLRNQHARRRLFRHRRNDHVQHRVMSLIPRHRVYSYD